MEGMRMGDKRTAVYAILREIHDAPEPSSGVCVGLLSYNETVAFDKLCALLTAHDALAAAARGLAANITDDMLETLRPEWGNTNVACIKHWQEQVHAALKLAESQP